ncbi:unnamed protein product [Prunus armeniaca]
MHHHMVQHSKEGFQSEGLVARTGGRGCSSKRGGKLSNDKNSRSGDNEGDSSVGLRSKVHVTPQNRDT